MNKRLLGGVMLAGMLWASGGSWRGNQSVPSGGLVVTPGGAVIANPYGATRQYATTPGSVTGQIICEKGEIDAKHTAVFWHEGEPRYGPKYQGMICIGPLQ